MNAGSTPRTLLLCVEGADWRVLSPRIDAGVMPALGSLVERGVSGRVAPIDRAGGVSAWATLLTGASAVRHGVLSERVPAEGGRSLRAMMCGDRSLPTVWERAAAAGQRVVAAGWGEPFAPTADAVDLSVDISVDASVHAVPGWAEAIAGPSRATEPQLADLLRRLSAAFVEELRATADACGALPGSPAWDLACVRVVGWSALVREFIRFAAPAGPGVPPGRAAAFGSVVDGACAQLDAWLGDRVRAAGDGAAVVVVGECGIDLERWRTPARLLGHETARGADVAPAAFVAAGPGMRPDSLRHGMLATDVLGIVLGVRGIDVPATQVDGAALALPAVPDGAVPDEVRDVLHDRDAAFAHAAAVTGAHDAAIAARIRMAERVPSDAASASALADLLVARGDAAAALRVVDTCRAAQAEARDAVRAVPWPLALAEARALVASERIADAHVAIDRAAAAGASAFEVLLARASVAASDEDHAASERHAREAIATAPARREARMVLARALFAQERFEDAADAAREALGMAWADPFAHLVLGTALAAAGRAREAIAALEDCLRVRPEFPPALRRLAAVHMRQLGDVGTAQAFMARAVAAMRSGSTMQPDSRSGGPLP
jgi:type IV pilus assembly protein PilF